MLTKAKIVGTSRHLRYLNFRTAPTSARLVAIKVLGGQREAVFVPRASFVSGARGIQ